MLVGILPQSEVHHVSNGLISISRSSQQRSWNCENEVYRKYRQLFLTLISNMSKSILVLVFGALCRVQMYTVTFFFKLAFKENWALWLGCFLSYNDDVMRPWLGALMTEFIDRIDKIQDQQQKLTSQIHSLTLKLKWFNSWTFQCKRYHAQED